ncbi:Ig-like domain-containing protein [Pengzhenrongella sp.]|uniref:Ig-like domain-containing protein n=1 Tax=Pengzhenrongella sp. TaxID=2888820 RepID=UPI002F9263ED
MNWLSARRQGAPRRARGLAATMTVLLALVGSGILVGLTASPGAAAVTDPFTQVFATSTTGDIQIRGNTVLSCLDGASACATARAGRRATNNTFFMDYVDVDGDPLTFNSSTARVDVPAGGSVLFAALTWGGDTTQGGDGDGEAPENGVGAASTAPDAANRGQVKLKVPGAGTYATVLSTHTSTNGGTYQGYLDVTSQVQAAGNGQYAVADVQAGTGTTMFGGWALTIAYRDPTAPARNLAIFSGFGAVFAGDDVDVPVAGFLTPPGGEVRTTLGSVSYEGDAGISGDQLRLGNDVGSLQDVADGLHPVDDTFTSVISDRGVDSAVRNPKYANQLGFDAATFDVDNFLPNGSTNAVIRLTSTNDAYYPGVVTFATDLAVPDLPATKSVRIAAKATGNTQPTLVEPGDTLEYAVDVRNDGFDASANTVLRDVVPAGTTYVPGSLSSGGVALTDAADADAGGYDAGTRQLTVGIGTGADAATGGKVAIGTAAGPVTFRVVAPSPDGASFSNTANLTFEGDQTGILLAGSSDTVTSGVVGHHSALAVTKAADRSVVQRDSGTAVTYTLTVSNSGPYEDPAVTVTDTLPAGALVESVTPSSGNCTTPAGLVRCDLGAVAVGAAAATITVRVDLDDTTGVATDTARVAGSNLDDDASDDVASVSTEVNTGPVASDRTVLTDTDTPVAIALLAGATDADDQPLSVSSVGPVGHGSVSVAGPGRATYTPDPGYAGPDTFTYTVSDGHGGAATPTVRVTVLNAAPIAVDDATSARFNTPVVVQVLANDSDRNTAGTDQVLTMTDPVVSSAGADVRWTADGTVSLTPDADFVGDVVLDYRVSDGAGGTDTGRLVVTFEAPVATALDDSATTPYDTSVLVDVLANDDSGRGLDPTLLEGSISDAVDADGAVQGTVLLQDGELLFVPRAGSALTMADAPRLSGPPPVGFSGTVTFDYTISNELGGTATARVTVTVEPELVATPLVVPATPVVVPATPVVAAPHSPPTSTLAQTGADVGATGAAAMLLMGLGIGAFRLARTRRNRSTTAPLGG